MAYRDGNRNLFAVTCKACDAKHYTDMVKFEDIEEDIQGRDIMTFECPVTGTLEKSLVLSVA